MLVDLQVVYSAEIVMPRHRNEQTVTVKHAHTIEIAEVSEEDAPVVCRRPTDEFIRLDERPTEIIRHFNGEFWRNAPRDTHTEDPAGAYHTAETLAQLITAPNSGDFDLPVPYRAYPHQLARAARDIGSVGAKTIKRTDLDEVLASVNEGARRFLIVDGQVFIRCSEPVYVYAGRNSYRNGYLQSELGHGSITRIFRLDDFDGLLAFANQCPVQDLHSRHPEIVAENEPNRAEVLLPGLLRWDPQREALHRSVGSVVDSARKVAPDMTLEAFAAYAALRDHVGGDFDASVDDEELAIRADLLIRLIRSVRLSLPDRHDWHHRDEQRAEGWLQSRRDLEDDLELMGSAHTP